MAHANGHAGEHGREADRRSLAVALAITAAYTVAEVVGGLLTGSLALLADAAHMLSDNLSLGLALFALWLSSRPPTPERSFGYKRAEILAALFNGVTLVAVSFWIFYEAYRRLQEPQEVLGGWVAAVAVMGLVVNAAAAWVLMRPASGSLNLQGALRHVLADLLGSLGVLASGITILLTGWYAADPLISAAIGLLVLASSWRLLRESVNILLEAAPQGINPAEIGRRMASTAGVSEVHDLHVWTITSGFPALSAHVLVDAGEDCHAKRRELERLLREEYGIYHTTLQVDHAGDHGSHGTRFLPLHPTRKPRHPHA